MCACVCAHAHCQPSDPGCLSLHLVWVRAAVQCGRGRDWISCWWLVHTLAHTQTHTFVLLFMWVPPTIHSQTFRSEDQQNIHFECQKRQQFLIKWNVQEQHNTWKTSTRMQKDIQRAAATYMSAFNTDKETYSAHTYRHIHSMLSHPALRSTVWPIISCLQRWLPRDEMS